MCGGVWPAPPSSSPAGFPHQSAPAGHSFLLSDFAGCLDSSSGISLSERCRLRRCVQGCQTPAPFPPAWHSPLTYLGYFSSHIQFKKFILIIYFLTSTFYFFTHWIVNRKCAFVIPQGNLSAFHSMWHVEIATCTHIVHVCVCTCSVDTEGLRNCWLCQDTSRFAHGSDPPRPPARLRFRSWVSWRQGERASIFVVFSPQQTQGTAPSAQASVRANREGAGRCGRGERVSDWLPAGRCPTLLLGLRPPSDSASQSFSSAPSLPGGGCGQNRKVSSSHKTV